MRSRRLTINIDVSLPVAVSIVNLGIIDHHGRSPRPIPIL